MVIRAKRGGDRGITDISTTECLRILLEQQLRELTILRGRAWHVATRMPSALPPGEWRGPAHDAYTVLIDRLNHQVKCLAHALDEAASASSQAVATLSMARQVDRVG